MRNVRYWAARLSNGVRKVGSGLRPFNESVWPGVRNDLFVAHQSIYRFAARFARDGTVLDAGCGTGYGSHHLAESGALVVTAIDIDRLTIGYARRHFSHPRIQFVCADCETLDLAPSTLDLVFASNVLEHLENPDLFLARACLALRPSGYGVFAVPPITSAEAEALHRRIRYHRSNFSVSRWLDLLRAYDWSVSVFAQRFHRTDLTPDFASPFPSLLSPGDYVISPSTVGQIYENPPIGVVFVAARPDRPGA